MNKYDAAAKERWPDLNKGERARGATLLRRLDHLRNAKNEPHNKNNHWINAEITALTWALGYIDHATNSNGESHGRSTPTPELR